MAFTWTFLFKQHYTGGLSKRHALDLMKLPPRLVQRIVFCLTLLPPGVLALLIFKYSVDLPQWDQWDYVPFFEKLSRGALTFADLFAQVNEYRQFFPNLIFVMLGWLTRWDVRYEMLLTFLTACLISLNVYRLAERTISGDRIPRLFLLLIANLIIFSPAQYQNWLQGQQLVYYVPIACVTTCLLVAGSGWKLETKFGVCAVLSVISTFSCANGILCWLVLIPILVLDDSSSRASAKRWLVIAWTMTLCSSAALYLFHYHKPWWSPSPTTALFHPLQAITYLFGFLGAPLALEKGKVAAVVGLILTSAFALSCFYCFRRRTDLTLARRMIVWLTIGAYSVLTGVMTTIGRLGFGVGQSQNTRYIGYSAYLIVALLFLFRIIAQDLVSRDHSAIQVIRLRRAAFLFAGAVVLLQPFIFFRSINRMAEMRTTILQAKALVLFINLKPDPVLIKILYPDVQSLTSEVNALNRLGFLRPGLIKSLTVREFADSDSSHPADYGSWDRFKRTDDGGFLASGQTTLPYRREAADAILLAYQTSESDTLMFRITCPQETSAGFWRRSQSGQWQVSFAASELPASPVILTAWGFDANTGKAFRLAGSFELSESDHSAKDHGPLKLPE